MSSPPLDVGVSTSFSSMMSFEENDVEIPMYKKCEDIFIASVILMNVRKFTVFFFIDLRDLEGAYYCNI